MPKRIVDGEAVWTSRKLKRCSEWIRGEYTNLLPLALSNGTFELDIDQIWTRVYSYLRPHITRENITQIFAEFETNGLVFRFVKDGENWGYFVGIEKPGRLPPKSESSRFVRGPDIPQKGLKEYIEHSQSLIKGIAIDSRVTHDQLALGGVGLGLGREGKGREGKTVGAHKERSHKRDESLEIFTGTRLKVTAELHESLGQNFPQLDRQKIYVNADGWLEQTGTRRSNVGRFLRNWCLRELTPKKGKAHERTESNLKAAGFAV